MMRGEAGMTLLELVVVAAIIGILATLAIANYAVFKANAYNTTAASDARHIEPAAELALGKVSGTFVWTLDGIGGQIDVVNLPGASSSPDSFGTVTVEPNRYTIQVWNAKAGADGLCYTRNSDTGTSVTSGPCA